MLREIYENHIVLESELGQEFKESISPVYMEVQDPKKGPTLDIVSGIILYYFPTSFVENYAINVANALPEEGEWAYTYGGRLALDKQLVGCIEKLKKFPDTRRATITYRIPSDIYKDNAPCLTTTSFMLRNGKLRSYTHIRSNEMIYAWPIDYMGLLYLTTRVAGEVGVEVGSISTLSISAHYYTNAEKILELII